MSQLKLKNVVKHYGEQRVVDNMSLELPKDAFTVILGPSGCGKSTLLRLVSSLEEVDSGEIYINDHEITNVETRDRKIAMVFQNYALYPHMTAYKNVEYGLKISKIKKAERHKMVLDALKFVELEDQAEKYPAQMSGGQRQRVALARAIVKSPEIYLLDEPLSNLDARLRNQMRQMLTELQKDLKKTFMYVTHDQVEAMSMGDYIVLLNQGKIMQQGTPFEIYTNPANIFVAKFIGSPPANILSYGNGSIAIRPEHFLDVPPIDQPFVKIQGEIVSHEILGAEILYHIQSSLGLLKVKKENEWEVKSGELTVYVGANNIYYFDSDGDRIYKPTDLLTSEKVEKLYAVV